MKILHFYVDVKKLSNDVKFFVDTTYNFDVYTIQNINSEAIYKTIDIDLNRFNI